MAISKFEEKIKKEAQSVYLIDLHDPRDHRIAVTICEIIANRCDQLIEIWKIVAHQLPRNTGLPCDGFKRQCLKAAVTDYGGGRGENAVALVLHAFVSDIQYRIGDLRHLGCFHEQSHYGKFSVRVL